MTPRNCDSTINKFRKPLLIFNSAKEIIRNKGIWPDRVKYRNFRRIDGSIFFDWKGENDELWHLTNFDWETYERLKMKKAI